MKYIFTFRVAFKVKPSTTSLFSAPGAGKTTQCPQYILEEALLSGFGDETNILCTQPRRISALSVAERVAEEMDDTVGKQVGYHIRMEAKRTKQTKLLFCTTGVGTSDLFNPKKYRIHSINRLNLYSFILSSKEIAE